MFLQWETVCRVLTLISREVHCLLRIILSKLLVLQRNLTENQMQYY